MIDTAIFDLDGTLVQTELLKARSYGLAVKQLSNGEYDVDAGIAAFGEIVGQPRREMALHIMRKFGLTDVSRGLMPRYNVAAPWQAFVQVRLEYYQRMLTDDDILRDAVCPNSVALFHVARERLRKVAVATMSTCAVADKVLSVVGIADDIDFLATADDIHHGKPDPEIDLLVAAELDTEPRRCVVVEDSAAGVKAALSAGMHCLAAVSEFTEKGVRDVGLLDERWIVTNPTQLTPVFLELLADAE